MPFKSYSKEAFEFLSGLEAHNEKAWFDPRKKVYEESVKAPTIALVEALNERLSAIAPQYRVPDPAKAIPRLNRDVRFSNDKSPYKTEVGAVFSLAGFEKQEVAGFYVGVSGKGVTVIGGAYMPGPPQLAALRAAFVESAAEFRALVKAPRLGAAMGELSGDRLKGVPRGFAKDLPAADLLGYTQVYFKTVLPPATATSSGLTNEIAKRFELMTPFVTWLDAALEPARSAKA